MKKILLLSILLSAAMCLNAQTDDPVAFEINGQKITKSEFMKEFLKSIGKSPEAAPTACTYEKRQKLEEYVQLFVNYRTKLVDAYAKGFDKNPELIKELNSYRLELAAPYLMDNETLQQILDEAYERNHYALHAAHILVKCRYDAKPEDTLAAYNMAMDAYNRVIGGEDFFAVSSDIVARQSTSLQGRQFRKNEREGDLGCFSAFDMVYPFESAAYSLEPGQISKPVRTRFGYHVVYLLDKMPFYGKTTLRHIWVSGGNLPEKAMGRINMAYQKLQEGESFENVARNYSDDLQSNDKGGLLMDMPLNQMPPDYVRQIANGLKEGEYTKPFKTIYGWHIIKLEHRDTIPSLEELAPLYKQRLSRDNRSSAPKEQFIAKSLERYHFVDYTKAYGSWKQNGGQWTFVPTKKVTKKSTYASSLQPVRDLVTDSVFKKAWVFDTNSLTERRPLMELDGRFYTTYDFCIYIAKNQTFNFPSNLDKYVENKYQKFIDETVMEYADSRLEVEQPEFGDLMNEYRHGLMIFAYNDQEIWSKAISDSLGLRAFYEQKSVQYDYDNPEEELYFWKPRARVNVIRVTDSACLAPEKAVKVVEKSQKKGWSSAELEKQLQKKMDKSCNDALAVHLDLYEEDNQKVLTPNEFRKGIFVHPESTGYTIFEVQDILPVELKSQSEARGYYINDYQNELERRLVEQLRQKYNVKIHQEVIDEITY